MPPFKDAISQPGRINLIAEIKRQSPSAGIIIKNNFNPAKLAKIYEKSGASAISVLTDKELFGGSLNDLKIVKKAVSLPVMRKDFIECIRDVEESAHIGCNAILLIVRNLSFKNLTRYYKASYAEGMDAVVEVHTKDDVEKALSLDAEIIGINNRDLETLAVTLKTTQRLIKLIPNDKIIISESGIRQRKDTDYLSSLGVNAILVGEALLKSRDIEKKVRELIGRKL